jgi:EAL domain-containing protein (putative c-di-GMP-specific phosphodiesterase class I)
MHTIDYENPVLRTALRFDAGLTSLAARDRHEPENEAVALTELERRVCEGLRAGEFHLVFQGVYHAATAEPARIDAQVRWMHPAYGLLLPGIFLMPLGHPQVAAEMASFMIDSVCRALRDAQRAGEAMCPVVITVPAQVAVLESFADELTQAARCYGVNPALLEIEIPESVDAARLLSLRTLTAGLRDAGVSLSLGDFGKGAAPLASIGALDVNTVSLSRDLMAAVPRDPRACIVASAMLDLLHALNVRVVVNGIETAAQLQWLERWPGVLVQGTLFSRPRRDLSSLLG